MRREMILPRGNVQIFEEWIHTQMLYPFCFSSKPPNREIALNKGKPFKDN